MQSLFFHISQTDGSWGWDQNHPASLNRQLFDDLLEKLGSAGEESVRVGFAVTFSVMQTSSERLVESLETLIALSEQTGVPVQVNVDGQNWWSERPDLWNWWDPEADGYDPDNRLNVEWTSWNPDSAVGICWRNWGRQIRVAPEQNLMSPAVLEATLNGIRPLAAVAARWLESLPEDRKHLFGGFRVGWETSIGVNAYHYPNGNRFLTTDRADDPRHGRRHDINQFGGLAPLGHAALTTAGIKDSGEINPEDIAEVVHRYLATLSKAAFAEGIPRHLLFTHQGGTYQPWDKHLPFWPAINEWSTPGWSFYGVDPGSPPQLHDAMKAAGQESWAAAEWWWEADDSAGWRDHFERTLGWKDCRHVTVYNWNQNGFRTNEPGLRAVRELLLNAASKAGPAPAGR